MIKRKGIIIDDEQHGREVMKSLLKICSAPVEIIDECDNIDSAYRSIIANKPDFIFLDVLMPGGNGFDLLKKFSVVPFKVVFVTSYDHYAIQAFKYSAVDYLLKPYDVSDLQETLIRLMNSFDTEPSDSEVKMLYLLNNVSLNEEERFLAVQQSDRVRFVKASDIIYIEADRNYTHITTLGNEKFVVSKTLKTFEETFDENKFFFRANKGVIINIRHIKEYSKSNLCFLYMVNGKEVEMGRRKKTELLNILKGL